MPTAAVFDPASVGYVDEMYQQFLQNPDGLTPEWRAYFMGFGAGSVTGGAAGNVENSNGADALARAWRERGHLVAKLNPLLGNKNAQNGTENNSNGQKNDLPPELRAETYGLDPSEEAKWRAYYGGFVGVECATLVSPDERNWVQNWWESERPLVANETQLAFYRGLVQANGLEQTLHKKFVGAKRFSIEGNDVVVPLLHQLAETAAAAGIQNMVMGMAHRGRLNVLCNILHKPYAELFAAFADKLTVEGGPSSGDVKYHAGKTYVHPAKAGPIELQLLYNPSHLEAVNPSVLGVARAKADAGSPSLAVLMHGDSAVAGQGVVAETNNLMALAAYNVGGTLHIIINNQIGFTADAPEAFGGRYCTDIFKSLGCPIVHVNADHPEACWRALRFCFEYRQKFGKDAVLDVVGYRRWGHNEGDDPTFTQPKMYEAVRAHPVPAEVYKAHLLQSGVAASALAAVEKECMAELDAAFATAQQGVVSKAKGVKLAADVEPETVAEAGDIKRLADCWATPPAGFKLNDKVAKVVEERVAMLRGEKPLNWGAAETAAYGCLLQGGIAVRMTGQDVQRGTFSHRHAVLTDVATNAKWNVLQGVSQKGPSCLVANSALSENAVMGFEYGYALGNTAALTLWEAQFGDFANGAQVVID
ncbi:MAG: 2-oxoglutarate dehydrogenase E1 component, partial [Proteobacteria bacterium]|nr:2-oxoglutarate dehydrogenase E1 component [Pseudomonadota bacterium]